jgi:hypothetical protein
MGEKEVEAVRNALRKAHAALRVSNPLSEEGYEGRSREAARAAIAHANEVCKLGLWFNDPHYRP